MSGLDNLDIVANVMGVADCSTKVIGLLIQYARDISNAKEDKAALVKEATALHYLFGQLKAMLLTHEGALLKVSRDLPGIMAYCEAILNELHAKLLAPNQSQNRRGGLFATLTWPLQSKDVNAFLFKLEKCQKLTLGALQVDHLLVSLGIDRKFVLDRLPVAEGASFDSLADQQDPICLADTRREIITKIEEWVADPSAKSIFWLNGMAGTGKSTISRTVADKFARTGQLSASFFFKRTYRDRAGLSRFFTTLGADLAVREPATASYIKAALDADPALIRKTAREQVDKLFFEPLIKTSKIRGDRPALIIIDALDECAPDDDIRLLVHLLSRVRVSHIPLRVKILITSRPDLHPRLAFQKIHGAYEDVILEKATESTVERDILIFLRQEMTNIRHDYNLTVTKDRQLADDWPAQEDIKYLSWIATPLFIVASTMCLLWAIEYLDPQTSG